MVLKTGPILGHDSSPVQLIGLESDQIGGPISEPDELSSEPYEPSGSILFYFISSSQHPHPRSCSHCC